MHTQEHRQKKRLPALLTALSAACLSVAITCSSLTGDGGFGSETTNGRISGHVLLPAGSPAVGAQVTLRRSNYIADVPEGLGKTLLKKGDCLTDTSGRFVFDSLDTGSYFVEINDRRSAAVASGCSIAAERRTIDIGTNTLRVYATVLGEINIDAAPTSAWFVQVYGLERCIAIGPTGTYTLDDLPAGVFRLRFVCSDSAVLPVTVDGVAAAASAVTNVAPVGWNHSQRLALNTTATGANVSGNVYRFPVLVRLTDGVNFTFSQARKNGEDVRYLSPSGRMLPYEIERWDSAGGQAEVWVLVDTVYGNNSAQFITMLWGNKSAKDNSNGAAVFDTADGNISVWHLDRNCNDACYNKNNAASSSALDTIGIIGYSKKFNGADSIKIAGLLGSPSSITLSAWAQLDSTQPGGGSEILSIGDAALIRMDYALGGIGTLGAIHQPGDSVYVNVKSGQFLKQTGWHLITFTVDQNNHNQALYIDGTNVRSAADMNAFIDYSGVGQNTFIGRHGNGKTGFNFSGRIDEVRVSRIARSADYIKLCYMNQKETDMLVVMKN
jgi:hypothetical protein